MKYRTLLLEIFIIISLLVGCAGPSALTITPVATPVKWPNAGWQTTAPEQQGMDSTKLADMLEYVQEKPVRLHSLMVVRNGYTLVDAYFNPYQPETGHQMASITKSVMGALVGIAIEQGQIKNIKTPVVNFFKDHQIANLDASKRAMTLEHLLTLSPGFDCSDIEGTEARMVQSEDWVQFVLDLPMKYEPGKQWSYCSSAVHLVSAILQQATGMDARSYANQHLFGPIGIAEVPAERWPADPQGVTMGGNGLILTPHEIAKFALLYLNLGQWKGRQVVPARWVAESTAPHVTVGKDKAYGDMNRTYGYLWSVYADNHFYSAIGRNGQHIHVFPDQNMLVIFTSATTVTSEENQFELLQNYILPAVQSETALAENPDGAARLRQLHEAAAWPRQVVTALPATAARISGKAISFEENPYGWESIVLTFNQGEKEASALLNGDQNITIGLDNLYRVQEFEGVGKLGYRGAWEGEDVFVVHQVIVGTFLENEIKLTFEGSEVTVFQRNIVDGGNLVRMVGSIPQ